jgi:hypothetical protein
MSGITTHLPPSRRRRRWPTVLLALVLFGAGGATGAAVTVWVVVHRLAALVAHPEYAPPRVARYLRRQLDLTDAQQAQVTSILNQRQAGLLAIRRDVDPRVQAELRLARDEVAAVLTPAQRPKWFAIFDRAHDRWLPPGSATQP